MATLRKFGLILSYLILIGLKEGEMVASRIKPLTLESNRFGGRVILGNLMKGISIVSPPTYNS